MFPLQDLFDKMVEAYTQRGITKSSNRTRLKETILEKFPTLEAKTGSKKRVFIMCSNVTRKITSEAAMTQDEEMGTLFKAASVLRKAVKEFPASFKFDGHFPRDCEESCVPPHLKYFFRQLLTGPKSTSDDEKSRKSLTLCQLTVQNMSFFPDNFNCESPLALYLGLKVHSETRNKKLVQILNKLALSVSYGKVLTIEHNFAHAIARAARNNGDRVCPSNLRRNIFTVAGLDNKDHNPSSRTASSSFRGTAKSIFQFPSDKNSGEMQEKIQINSQRIVDVHNQLGLPKSYTFVSPLEKSLVAMPPLRQYHRDRPIDSHSEELDPSEHEQSSSDIFKDEILHEAEWLDCVNESIHTESVNVHQNVTWYAFHANRSDHIGKPYQCIEAILPLFHAKAATPEMIRHGMELIKKLTVDLNPTQIPVTTVDQPLYDLAKKNQWTFPDSLGEDRFVVLLGGLHIEMALWSTLGDLMLGSGWPESLKDPGIVNSLAAGMCLLKAVNVMRTRYAHQVTTAVFDILKKKAFKDSGTSLSLEEWISVLSEQYPTFKFWSLVLKYQRDIFLFIRANRERKINMMIRSLKDLLHLFFAFDHHNYARWIPVFIQDLEALPKE